MTSGGHSAAQDRIRGGRGGGSLGETGGAGGERGGDKCQPVYKGAGLASPKSAVLSKLKAGDVLDLEPQPQGQYYVLYALKSGAPAGVVTHMLIDQIIACIVEGGHKYVAYIKTLQGGSCNLEIRMEP
jgi:hypothetical protein